MQLGGHHQTRSGSEHFYPAGFCIGQSCMIEMYKFVLLTCFLGLLVHKIFIFRQANVCLNMALGNLPSSLP